MVAVTLDDEAVRGALTRLIADLGHAPSTERLADAVNLPLTAVEQNLRNLADAHALLLHPGSVRPWAVHPFALAPGSCWVETEHKGYWANCLYCGLGIAAALKCEAVITTRYGGEAETAQYSVRGGRVEPADDVFHLSTPPVRWWDNVVFACSTFQPFRSEHEIAGWCERHDLPRGGVLTIPQLWGFAQDWYGGYIDQPWRKRSADEARAIFERNGLTGPFWRLD